MKIRTYYSSIEPLEFERNDYTVTLRIDIKQEVAQDQTELQYSALEFTLYEPVTQNGFIKLVLDEIFGYDYENKLINEYNSAMLGLYDEEVKTDKINQYSEFLNKRISIKSDIERICNENGIF